MRVEHKVALISGGARGMGAAEAKLFATERANVVVGNVLDEEGVARVRPTPPASERCAF